MKALIPSLPDDIARECINRVSHTNFSTIAAVCRGWKEEIESPEFHQRRKSGGLTRPVFVFNQSVPSPSLRPLKYPSSPAYHLTLYEPASGEWSKLPAIPDFPQGLPLFCQCAGAGRNLVVIGGWNPVTWEVSKAVFVYSLVFATWKRVADMPGESRSFFACASDSDRMVFVAGGHDEEKNALRSAMAYDVEEDKWIPLPDMFRERDECKGIFQRGKFHVIGGYCTEMQGRFEKSAESFDVATWQWGQVVDVFKTGTCPRTCVASDELKMYRCQDGHVVLLKGDTWDTVAELPVEIRVSPLMVTWQGIMLVIGSAKCGGPYTSYTLDPKSYTWNKVETPVEYSGHVQGGCCLDV